VEEKQGTMQMLGLHDKKTLGAVTYATMGNL